MTRTLVAMNCEPNKQMKNAVPVWMILLVWGRLVLPSPIPNKCHNELDRSKDVTGLLHLDATTLLNIYTEIYNIKIQPVPDEVPKSTVTGSNLSEKLQDIYATNRLFEMHLLLVEIYQWELLYDPDPLIIKLSVVKHRLSNHFHRISDTLKCELTPEPAPPTALPVNHQTDYQKKIYGWGVIYRLTEWSKEVLKVLNETKNTTKHQKTQMKEKTNKLRPDSKDHEIKILQVL